MDSQICKFLEFKCFEFRCFEFKCSEFKCSEFKCFKFNPLKSRFIIFPSYCLFSSFPSSTKICKPK